MRHASSLHPQATILDKVAGGVVLIGTTASLASAFDVTATAFLSALSDLMEGGRVTVQMEPRGQISVRLDSRFAASADRPV